MYGRGKTGAPAGNWNLVRDTSPTVRALGIGARVVSMAQATAPCVDTANVLCLNFGRFRTELRFRQPNDQEGLGTDSGLRTDDSGVLWFFNASNLEMLVKVLDACVVNNHYWVFFAATTNVEFAHDGDRHAGRQGQDLLQPAQQGSAAHSGHQRVRHLSMSESTAVGPGVFYL